MPYLISEGVFDDAFILHDPTSHYFHVIDLIQEARQKGNNANKNAGNPARRRDAEAGGNESSSSDSSDDDPDEETLKNSNRLYAIDGND